MTQEEWDASADAKAMLRALHSEKPIHFRWKRKALHRYLIACCWKHVDLLPDEGNRAWLNATKDRSASKISKEDLAHHSYCVEGAAFFLDYCDEPEDITKITAWISEIEELEDLPFDKARKVLMRAAYFADRAVYGFGLRGDPEHLDSKFLCPDL